MKGRLLLAVLLVASMVLGTVSVAGADSPVVTAGFDSSALIKAKLNYRNLVNPAGLNGYEGILGDGDLNPNVQNDFYRGTACDATTPYGSWNASNHVRFEYSATTGLLTARVDANPSYCMEYNIGDLGELNYLQLDVYNRAAGTRVDFTGVTLNGVSLGDFVGTGGSTWQVKGVDLSSDFVIEGNLELAWPTPAATSGQEVNKLTLSVGYVTPPPAIELNASAGMFCGTDTATVDVDLTNVVDLYGYQFQVSYDPTKLSATAAFENAWFDTVDQQRPWDATCDGAAGICSFAVSKVAPATAVSGSGTVARITFTAVAPGTPEVRVLAGGLLTDSDGTAAVLGEPAVTLSTCGIANISGVVSLQGRATPIDSGTVTLTDGVFGPYSASFDAGTGAWSINGVKFAAGGTDYTFLAAHGLYLGAEKTVSVTGDLTGQSTRLKGGDANNDGKVGLNDLSCIGGGFGVSPVSDCGGLGSADINADGVVNIQDLAITGGNYGLSAPQPW